MVTDNPDGSLTFRHYDPHASEVIIQGDFSPSGPAGIPMERDSEGWWRARVRVAPGDHSFRYVVNGQGSIPDYAAGGLARDAAGAWVSLLHVPEPAAAAGAAVREVPVVRSATISDAEIELLLSGRRIELPLDDGSSGHIALSIASPRGGLRAAPRPDRPIERAAERRRDSGRIDRHEQHTRA